MLKGLLTPAWQNESVEKRLHAVEKLNPDEEANQDILLELVKTDADLNVRRAALSKLNQPERVWEVKQTHKDQATCQHAESVFTELIGPKSKLTEVEFSSLLKNHGELKLSIAAHCPFENLRHQLIDGLCQTDKAELLNKIDYSQTRHHIAEQLSDIEALELARKQIKGKDKRAEKIIRTKLDDHHANERQTLENQNEALMICEKMEVLASHEWDTEFGAKYNIWSQRWDGLEFTPPRDIADRFNQARSKAAGHVEQMAFLQTTAKGQESLSQKLHQHCLKIAPLSWQSLNEHASETKAILNSAAQDWAKLNNEASAAADVTKSFLSYQAALTSVLPLSNIASDTSEGSADTPEPSQEASIKNLGDAIKQVTWSSKLPTLAALEEANIKHDELKQALTIEKKDYSDKLDKLHKRINRLLGSTKRGNLQQAKREFNAISKASEKYTGKDKTALSDRLEAAEQALSKMGDWKDFATEPKYVELCDEMEALSGNRDKTHPDALAGKIAKLQKRWKALGHSDSADQHWDRFKMAADKAYEPCTKFFEQRHLTRAKNLEKREPLVKEMQELLDKTDWEESPNYKEVETKLQNISKEWQKIKDVERDAGQQQWDRLSKFKTSIYAKLDVVYDNNLTLKKTLIEQAQTLLEKEPNEDMFSKLQLFQSRWKQVGITRRKQDQKAWKQFKAATDAIYQKLQGERKAKRAEENSQLEVYRDVTRKVRSLAKTANNLAQADSEFDQLQLDYKALPPLPNTLPEKLTLGISKDFQRACDAYSKARTRITKQVRDQAMQALKDKAALCCEMENATTEDEIKRLSEAIEQIELGDKTLSKRFAKRLKAAQKDDRAKTIVEATKARESLCLDLEILLDVNSPNEAKAQRMQVQLERLKTKGLGQAVQDKQTALKEIKLTWLCLPSAESETQAKLEKRFQAALSDKTR